MGRPQFGPEFRDLCVPAEILQSDGTPCLCPVDKSGGAQDYEP
jgi:hypothetical protein